MMRPRYEVQVRMPFGWVSAGNFPARDKAEGQRSLVYCAVAADGQGSVHDHRLVRLQPKVIAIRRATRKAKSR